MTFDSNRDMDAKGFAASARTMTMAAALFFLVPSVQAQGRLIQPVGGTGGSAFTARCPAGQILGGVELRVGDDVDAIRPLCRTPSSHLEKVYLGPTAQPTDPYLYRDVVTYEVSEAIATSDWVGAGRGGIRRVECDVPGQGQTAGTAVARKVVTGMYVEAEGVDVVVVNNVTLLCQYFPPYQTNYGRSPDFRTKPDVEASQQTFEAPRYNEVHTGAFDSRAVEGSGKSICAGTISNSKATVAVGIHGRAGKSLDALGVICEDPKLLVAVRPVAEAQPSPGTPRVPVLTICEAAQQARARNSLAAPGLEARCVNPEPVASLDRPRPAIGGPSGIIYTICEAALKARERDSPAAPGLEKRCREINAFKSAARVRPLQPTMGAMGADRISTRDAVGAADSTGGSETVDGTSTQAAAKTLDVESNQARLQTTLSDLNNAETLRQQVAKKTEAREKETGGLGLSSIFGGQVVGTQVGKTIGGVQADGTSPRSTKSTLSKCEAAKQARARNSPAAPGLEAQCAAQLANEASSVASSSEVLATDSRAARKTDLQLSVAEQNRRQKEVAAELENNVDESAISKIGNLISGGDPQPSGVATAVQKQGAGGAARRVASAFQTENTIAVRVRYLKEYGFKADTSAFRAPGPAACAVFSVSAAVTGGSSRQRNPFPVSTGSKLEQAGDYYVCNYVVSQVPLDQAIAVNVTVSDSDLMSAWVGGGEPQPQTGQQRTVVDAIKTATLNTSQPRARLSYEMVYAPVLAR
jgi:hypothetical protein